MNSGLVEQYKSCLVKLKFLSLYDVMSLTLSDKDIIVTNFKYGSNISNVYIPYGVTALSDGCFSGTEIESVSLCSSIEKVGYGCFANCPNLKKITIYEAQKDLMSMLCYGNKAKIVVCSHK